MIGRKLFVVLIVALLGACVPRVDNRGHLPDPELIAEIRPGEITRDEVEEILGSPSSVSPFGGRTWYYISKQTETTAFFEAEVKERQVLVLHFDDRGALVNMEKLGLDKSRKMDPVDRETPTTGNEITIFDQLLGNLGRFNKKGGE